MTTPLVGEPACFYSAWGLIPPWIAKNRDTDLAGRRRGRISFFLPSQKQNASIMGKVEQDIAGRAASGGPLTIMKKAADAAEEQKKERSKK